FVLLIVFFFQAEDGIRDRNVTGVQTCALPISIERYVRDGLLVPDLVVPMSEHRTFKYFKEETLQKYAQQYGWTLIDDSNRKDLFLDMVRQMDMSYSYKPVLLKAVLLFADDKGRVKLSDIVTYFREFYEARRAAGMVVEKANS